MIINNMYLFSYKKSPPYGTLRGNFPFGIGEDNEYVTEGHFEAKIGEKVGRWDGLDIVACSGAYCLFVSEKVKNDLEGIDAKGCLFHSVSVDSKTNWFLLECVGRCIFGIKEYLVEGEKFDEKEKIIRGPVIPDRLRKSEIIIEKHEKNCDFFLNESFFCGMMVCSERVRELSETRSWKNWVSLPVGISRLDWLQR